MTREEYLKIYTDASYARVVNQIFDDHDAELKALKNRNCGNCLSWSCEYLEKPTDEDFCCNRWEPWQPKPGEWCWFCDEDMNFTILGRYAGYEDGAHICVQYTYGNYKSYDYCEPFTGQLPTNTLKETNGTNISILLDY